MIIEEIIQGLKIPPGFHFVKATTDDDYVPGYLCVEINGPRRIVGVAKLTRMAESAIAKIESDWEPWW